MYLGLQGSTLTLMGVLKFDAKTSEFKLTKTAGFLAGGFAEAKEFLSELA